MPSPQAPQSPESLLSVVPLFSSLNKRQLHTIAETAKDRSYRPGETIVKQGDVGIGFYMIVQGEANVVRDEKVVAGLRPGQFFGEMALLDEEPRTADVRATTAVRCIILSPWEFWSTVGKDPEVVRSLLKETVRRLRTPGVGLTE